MISILIIFNNIVLSDSRQHIYERQYIRHYTQNNKGIQSKYITTKNKKYSVFKEKKTAYNP